MYNTLSRHGRYSGRNETIADHTIGDRQGAAPHWLIDIGHFEHLLAGFASHRWADSVWRDGLALTTLGTLWLVWCGPRLTSPPGVLAAARCKGDLGVAYRHERQGRDSRRALLFPVNSRKSRSAVWALVGLGGSVVAGMALA